MNRLITIIFLLISGTVFTQYIPEWAQKITIPEAEYYEVTQKNLATDAAGNVYTSVVAHRVNPTLSGVITRKYNSMGVQQWETPHVHDPDSLIYVAGIYPDNQGGVYVLCGSRSGFTNTSDIFLMKFSSTGALLNVYTYNHPNGVIRLYNTTFDNNSNIYFTGTVQFVTLQDYNDSVFTGKISTSGQVQWTKNYRGNEFYFYNEGLSIKLDAGNNVYITGSVSGNDTTKNICIIKYSSNGAMLWAQNYGFGIGFDDVGYDIALDNSQNVIVSGGSLNEDNNVRVSAFIKYNNSGQLLWADTNNIEPGGSFGFQEIGKKFIVDAQNNIYCNVTIENYSSPVRSYIMKINSNGQLQWVNNSQLLANNIYLDNGGNILLFGSIMGYFRRNMAIMKIIPSGASEWLYQYSYNGTGSTYAYNAFFYNDSKILIEGRYGGELLFTKFAPGLSSSALSVKNNVNKSINDNQYTYDTITFNLPANSYVKNVYVTVDTIIHPAIGDLDISLVHGNKEDTLIYRRGGSFPNFLGTNLGDTSSLSICNGGIPPYTGYFMPCKALSQFISLPAAGPWILKIWDRRSPNTGTLKAWKLNIIYEYPIGISQISSEVPVKYNLLQNYPNPFNPNTIIRFAIPKSSLVKITVYDITGRLVETLVNSQLTAGTYEAEFSASHLSSGVYFYKLVTNDFSETKKMILVK